MMRPLVVSCSIVAVAAQRLDARFDAVGGFSILRDGKSYLSGSEYQVAGLSHTAGSLQLAGAPITSSGSDALGAFRSTTLEWAPKRSGDTNSSDILMQTSFRVYPSDPGMIVFEQKFPKALGRDTEYRGEMPERADDDHKCRVVTGPYVLTENHRGYSAYTPDTTAGEFRASPGQSCDSRHQWAFTSDLSRASCAAKCFELSCACYDHSDDPTPSPPSSTSAARTVFPAFTRSPGV